MSAARFGKKWADVDEDDEDDAMASPSGGAAKSFETVPDENGIKLVIDYTERDGKTYKVVKRVKQTKITSWTNQNIIDRKDMKKFGKPALNDAATEKHLIVRSEEEIPVELSKKLAASTAVKDEAEDKFYEESISMAEGMNQQKKAWTDMNRDRQAARDEAGGPDKPEEPAHKPTDMTAVAAAVMNPDAPKSTYVPPSLRGKGGEGADGKGKGKGGVDAQQEASLRITNLSEDCREGDLQDLFGQVGRLQRVYLAKDQTTGLSRGFAFITYYTREDAQKAINKLHGHGYDNLILQVQFAKPRA